MMSDFDDVTNAIDTMFYPRHRWYFVKEGFSPLLVSKAITDSDCQKKDMVIDVFCGGGTTPLVATVGGYSAIGFEVNPFLAFVARTKLITCKGQVFYENHKRVLENAIKGAASNLINFSTFSENGKSQKWLFNEEVLSAFEGGWRGTIGMYAPVRDLIRLCLIGAAMDVCNAVKDGKCLRYKKNWKALKYGGADFITAFSSRVKIVKQDLDSNPLQPNENCIINADSRTLEKSALNEKPFKLCITSPPYLNSFDYSDIYRPELYLGKFLRSKLDLYNLRPKTIRSHVQIKRVESNDLELSPLLSQSIEAIKDTNRVLWHTSIPSMIQAYFEDMKIILENLEPLAAQEAQVWMAVSTSAYAGVEIPVDLIIAHIGTQCGWSLREIKVAGHLRRIAGQQRQDLTKSKTKNPRLRESVIVFENNPHIKHFSPVLIKSSMV